MKQPKKLSMDSRRKLLEILASRHSHSEVTDWAACTPCQARFMEYKQAKAKLIEVEQKAIQEDVLNRAIEVYARKYVEKVKAGMLKTNPLE